jgi:hypothetical protein
MLRTVTDHPRHLQRVRGIARPWLQALQQVAKTRLPLALRLLFRGMPAEGRGWSLVTASRPPAKLADARDDPR